MNSTVELEFSILNLSGLISRQVEKSQPSDKRFLECASLSFVLGTLCSCVATILEES